MNYICFFLLFARCVENYLNFINKLTMKFKIYVSIAQLLYHLHEIEIVSFKYSFGMFARSFCSFFCFVLCASATLKFTARWQHVICFVLVMSMIAAWIANSSFWLFVSSCSFPNRKSNLVFSWIIWRATRTNETMTNEEMENKKALKQTEMNCPYLVCCF